MGSRVLESFSGFRGSGQIWERGCLILGAVAQHHVEAAEEATPVLRTSTWGLMGLRFGFWHKIG